MRRFSDWKLKSQLIITVLAVIIVLAGTLLSYTIFASLKSGQNELNAMATVIDRIASRTSLLSMNAAIEAALGELDSQV